MIGALVGVLVGGLALAGCQSNPEPPPLEETESPSPSATPSTSPTEAAPTLPPEAKGADEAAAKAFVRHYVDLINHATATGDTAPLIAASAKRCSSCTAIVERIAEVYEAGGSIKSEGWTVQSVIEVPLQPDNRPIMDVALLMSEQVVRQSADAEPERFEGGKLPATFHLALSPDGWIVVNWERVS